MSDLYPPELFTRKAPGGTEGGDSADGVLTDDVKPGCLGDGEEPDAAQKQAPKRWKKQLGSLRKKIGRPHGRPHGKPQRLGSCEQSGS